MVIKLDRFKVTNFRSIEKSDWIQTAENSCLIGTNEAGKTNLLIALWKLNPANKEPIVPLDDFPRHLYSNFKADNHSKDIFIEADFILDETIQNSISLELGCDQSQVKRVLVCRRYNSNYIISFPYSEIESFPKNKLTDSLNNFQNKLYKTEWYLKESEQLKSDIQDLFAGILNELPDGNISKDNTVELYETIKDFSQQSFGKKKKLPEFFESELLSKIQKIIDSFDGKPVETTSEVRNRILELIPKFVYYSDYGNLDSEIFLPRVIEDFERDDLTESARAKARTLDVLFKYVKLSPRRSSNLEMTVRLLLKQLILMIKFLAQKKRNYRKKRFKIGQTRKENEGSC